MSEQKYVKLRVRTEYIDKYPELFESYKRQMGVAMQHLYDMEADWDTFQRVDYADDVLSLEEEKPYSLMVVMAK